MKITLPSKFCIALLLFLVTNLSAQDRSAAKNFLWILNLPGEMERGPMQVGIGGTYYFTRESGEPQYANLHMSFTKMNFLGNGIPSYKYNGTVYLANAMHVIDGLDIKGFDQLQVTSVKFKIQVLGAQANIGGKNAFILVESTMGGVNHAVEISKETNLDLIDLQWAGSFLTDLNWINSGELESRIRNLEKLRQNKEDYKIVIQQADNAFNRNNLEEARSLYKKAENLSPNESYPKTQLSKIENALAQKEKRENTASQKDQVSEKPVNTSTEKPAGTNTEQPIVKTARSESPEQTKAEKDREIRAKVDAQMAEIRRNQQEAQRIETDLVNKAGNLSQAFSQSNRASSSARAMQEARLYDKDFNSIEELNQEFSRQMQIIEQESNNYASAKTAAVNSYLDATSNSGSQYDAAINSSMKALGGLLSQMKADKEEKENKERLRAERETMIVAIENKRKAAIFGMRKKIFELFPDGKLPLESNNVKQDQVYVFAYIANKDILLTQENAAIAVSNVITVEKLDDGSFPYKSAFTNNLKKFGTGTVSVSGYYTNESDAEKMLNSFIGLTSKSNLQITRYNYNTIAAKKKTSSVSTADFWETGDNDKVQSAKKEEKEEKVKTADFWND